MKQQRRGNLTTSSVRPSSVSGKGKTCAAAPDSGLRKNYVTVTRSEEPARALPESDELPRWELLAHPTRERVEHFLTNLSVGSA